MLRIKGPASPGLFSLGARRYPSGMFEFSTFQRPSKPNNYLLSDQTGGRPADGPGAVYGVDEKALKQALLQALVGEPRLEVVNAAPDAAQWEFVQRSQIFRFADDIVIEFAPADGVENGTKLSIFSASRVGYSDMGVNKARVTRWLDKLSYELGREKRLA